MTKQERYDSFYMSVAINAQSLSFCLRKKVGAVIVKDGNILSFGFNGTPSGMDNSCEECDKTHWYTLHAEANAILKCAKEGKSTNEATLYVTCSPCKDCSKLIIQAGISRIVYIEEYRESEHIDFLLKRGITVHHLPLI